MMIAPRIVTTLLTSAFLLSVPAGDAGAQQVGASGSTRAAAMAGVDTLAIRAYTRFLADDLLAGRGAGTEGEQIAAAYIESQLMRLGLEPVGASFRHDVPLVAARIEAGTRVLLRRGAHEREFETPAHFVWNTGGAGAFRDFAGRTLFAGTPDEAEAALAGVELRGTVVVLLGLPGAAAGALVPDWIARGVSGVIVLAPEPGYYDLVARSRGDVRYFVDARLDDPVWQPDLPVIVAGPQLSAALFEGSGELADVTLPRELGAELFATVRIAQQRVPAANLAAVVPGSDAARRHEFVAYTAHYDHLGIGAPDATGDSIYNGFSDNAAGVAMLLAIAERFAAEPPPRSVLFLFFTAEERGLLGSTHFAAAPPLPLERIRALINLDAGAPPAPPVSWRIAAGEHADRLVDDARHVAGRHGWRVDIGSATPNSDHWPFAARGVPAIFIIPGADWQDTAPAEAQALRARWDRYHQPADRWHPDFPFAGLGRYADFAREVGRRAAHH